MSLSDRTRQRTHDLANIQRWRNANCHPGGEAFAVVEKLLYDLRREPLVPQRPERDEGCPECSELKGTHKLSCRRGAMMLAPDAPKARARVRAEVIVGLLEEILLAKALDVSQEPGAPLALAGHLISKLQALGVDLS